MRSLQTRWNFRKDKIEIMMSAFKSKQQENNRQSRSGAFIHHQGGRSEAAGSIDNRPQASLQRKMQVIAENGPHAQHAAQLKAMLTKHVSWQHPAIQKKENNTGLPDSLLQRMPASVQLMDEDADAATLLADEENVEEGEEHGDDTNRLQDSGDEGDAIEGLQDEDLVQAKFVFPPLGVGTPGVNAYAGGTGIVQRKTEIQNSSQSYRYDKSNVNVGSTMEAWLDPADPRQGQSALVNKSQDDMMASLRKKWRIKGGAVVKGHLLNDNLGGSAENNNLYPITAGANATHLRYVENQVKKRVWEDKKRVYYKVDVEGIPSYSYPKAAFDCYIHEWDGKPGTKGASISSLSVKSDLKDVRLYHNIRHISKKIKKAPLSFKNPKKPSKFKHPKTRISELTKEEIKRRNNQR